MIKDYIEYSFRNLTRRKVRSWLTMIGIFIGIAAVIALIGLGEGLRIAIVSQFGFVGSDMLSVQAAGASMGAPGAGAAIPLSNKLADKIDKIKGVELAYNRYIKSGSLEFNNKQDMIFIESMPEGEGRKSLEKTLNVQTSEGRLLKDGDVNKVMLGHDFADNKDTYGRVIKAGDKIKINGKDYQVVGILAKKGSFIIDQVVFINEKSLLDQFGDDGTVSMISVKVKNEQEINIVKDDIERLLRKERNVKKGEEDFTVQSPESILNTLNSTLFAVQLFVYIIASISLLVGGIGITNTMFTSVLERTKEIGVMKSIGAKNSSIFIMFSIESGLLGLVGGIIGITIGLILAYGLAFLGRLALGSELIQANVSIWLIVGALFFSFIIGTIAGVLPAYRASKLHPVDALRHAK